MARFGMAIAWHAAGFAVRRESWPQGQHVRQDFLLRIPFGHLAKLRDWDPAPDDISADDWTHFAPACADVIDAETAPDKTCPQTET